MKLVFLDTEFTGERSNTTLVALGMITLSGESIYVSLSDYDRSQVSSWLVESVISQIDEKLSVTSLEAAILVRDWLERISNGEKIHIVSYGKSQDLILLFELWRQFKSNKEEFHYLYDLPEYLNHSEHLDFCTLLVSSGFLLHNFKKVEYADLIESGLLHNALYDAKLLRACFFRLLTENTCQKLLNQRIGLEIYNPYLFNYESNISFSINETNLKYPIFDRIPDYIDEEVFSINRIEKKSIDSELFVFNGDKCNYVARIFYVKEKEKVEAQCQLVNTSSNNLMLKPLKSKRTEEFVTSLNNQSVIVYPYISGNIFDGNPNNFKSLFITIDQLVTAFNKFPKVNDLPNFDYTYWNLELIELLRRDKQTVLSSLRNHSKDFSLNFLNIYYLEILKELDWILSQNVLLKSNSIVHTDLNHSNILTTYNGFKIIDIEDIGFSNQEVALGHFLFKIFRHSIYRNYLTIDQFVGLFQSEYRKILRNLINFQKLLENYEFFVIARIYYDIHLILEHFLIRGDDRYMYDFNKKISNLIEFKRMFGNGFKSQG